jgi:gas vesicle protein
LKESKFVITTNNEADVCKEALLFVSQKSDELKQVIEDGKKEVGHVIEKDMAIAKESIQKAQNDAVKELNDLSKTLYDRVKNVETGVPEKVEKLKTDFSERVGKVEADISVLKSDVSSVEEVYHFVIISL